MFDCRKKNELLIERFSGDLIIKFIEKATGKVVFEEWFELKAPAKQNYERIKKLLQEIQTHLKNQEDSKGIELVKTQPLNTSFNRYC